jgi:UDP-GlcNAc:undecaprenyl-phosphate GlcNAc-1-phosphate transferase
MTQNQSLIAAAVVSAGISVAAVLVVTRLARRLGLVSRPGSDRWGKKQTPLLGGAAVLCGFVAAYLAFGEPDTRMAYILIASGLLFVLGLADDIRGLKPNTKLIGQAGAACLLIYGGVYVDIWFPTIGIPLSIAWFVGMSNAVNLLDNMDGVASGVCAISAGVLVFHALSSGCTEIALASAALCGSCVGFVVFNFHPAKIFLGDSGSLFLGMTLAALGVTATYREATNVLITLIVPVMVLGVPLFDMFFVSVLRKGYGRSLTAGGKDHAAHRLVLLGLSERKASVLFYAVCLALGVASVAARASMLIMLLVAGLAGAALLLVSFLLGRVRTYPEQEETAEQALSVRLFSRYRRAAGLAIFDMLAVTGAFVAAYLIRFDWQIPDFLEKRIPEALPAIAVIKLLCFLLFKLYGIRWEEAGRREIWRLFKAVTAGSIMSAALVAAAYQFYLFSRSVFIIDWLLCLVLLGGARLLLPAIAGQAEEQPPDRNEKKAGPPEADPPD